MGKCDRQLPTGVWAWSMPIAKIDRTNGKNLMDKQTRKSRFIVSDRILLIFNFLS
jgi:hypothetical protein